MNRTKAASMQGRSLGRQISVGAFLAFAFLFMTWSLWLYIGVSAVIAGYALVHRHEAGTEWILLSVALLVFACLGLIPAYLY